MLCLELFSGTGSIGRAFVKLGWTVLSLDKDPKFNPTICVDILDWDYAAAYPRDHFQFVWSSPFCTEYSRGKTVGIRDLERAERLVR